MIDFSHDLLSIQVETYGFCYHEILRKRSEIEKKTPHRTKTVIRQIT